MDYGFLNTLLNFVNEDSTPCQDDGYKQISREKTIKLTDKINLLKIEFEIVLSPERKLPRFVNVILIFGDILTLINTGVK